MGAQTQFLAYSRPYEGPLEASIPVTPTKDKQSTDEPIQSPKNNLQGTSPSQLDQEDSHTIAVGVGLSSSTAGSKQEKALLDQLEHTVRASTNPPTTVRRLRAGAAKPRVICQERRDDLILLIDYLPDREDPVITSYDCQFGRDLGVRSMAAGSQPELIAVLWEEHRELIRQGVRERRASLAISPKLRKGLIAGGAILVLGTAVGLIIASSLRKSTVVLTVSP